METVTIGCRFPNGYVLEVGLQTTIPAGPQNRPVSQLKQLPNYQRIVLKGTHAHTADLRRQRIQTPAMLNAAPYINRNVPKAVWDEWLREHPNNWAVKSGNLFEVKDGKDAANVKAASADAAARPAILQPLDPTKKLTLGPNGEAVETNVKDT